jgi:hypothetical protein
MAETPAPSRTRVQPTDRPDAPDGRSDDHAPDGRGDDPLLAWALASFHATLLLVVPLTLVHAVAPGVLGDLLADLDTIVGVALFVVLWGSTWWSNRRYLAASDADDVVATLVTGAKWGSVTGLPLFGCLVLAVLAATNPTFAGLLAVVGAVVAPLVGAVVGATLGGVDLALDRVARRLLP